MLNKQRNLIVQCQDEMGIQLFLSLDYSDNWNEEQVKNME